MNHEVTDGLREPAHRAERSARVASPVISAKKR
jgi:hypothetical protein